MTTTDSLRWFKSSYSDNGGNCIEVCGDLVDSRGVAVRDSKNPNGPSLILTEAAFIGLVQFAKLADA